MFRRRRATLIRDAIARANQTILGPPQTSRSFTADPLELQLLVAVSVPCRMPGLGKRTFGDVRVMSALPPIADIARGS